MDDFKGTLWGMAACFFAAVFIAAYAYPSFGNLLLKVFMEISLVTVKILAGFTAIVIVVTFICKLTSFSLGFSRLYFDKIEEIGCQERLHAEEIKEMKEHLDSFDSRLQYIFDDQRTACGELRDRIKALEPRPSEAQQSVQNVVDQIVSS